MYDHHRRIMDFEIENKCNWNESLIKFIDSDDSLILKHSIPPYLISYQGSDITFIGLIIELITGFCAGSSLNNNQRRYTM